MRDEVPFALEGEMLVKIARFRGVSAGKDVRNLVDHVYEIGAAGNGSTRDR